MGFKELDVNVTGIKYNNKRLSIIEKNIKKATRRWTKDEMFYLKKLMKIKIAKFSRGGLLKSLHVKLNYETDNTLSYSLFTDHPSANQNEWGTAPRFLTVRGNEQLQDWIKNVLGEDPDDLKSLQIGGTNSRVKLGNSDNKFFFNTVEEYLEANPTKRFAKRLNKAMNE